MVPVINSSALIYLLDRTQSGSLAENQAILDKNRKQCLCGDIMLDNSTYHTTNR